ncbi:MAG: twin-arginine translocase TatA/TatE family subunit [Bdellovibrionota bacterium]
MELSFSEILVVCLVAFLVFGPEDFIRKSRQFGEWMGRMKAHTQNFRVMAEEELSRKSGLRDVKNIIDDVQIPKNGTVLPADKKSDSSDV